MRNKRRFYEEYELDRNSIDGKNSARNATTNPLDVKIPLGILPVVRPFLEWF